MPLGRVLVTGAGGFLGRHLTECAAARGLESLAAEGDLRRLEAATLAVERAGPSAVVHLASARAREADAATAALADDALIAANVLRAVAELAQECQVLIPGSAAQYGLAAPAALDESAPLAPVGAYGAAKTAIELASLDAGTPRVIFARTFNLLGPGQPPRAPVASWARQLAAAESAGAGTLSVGRLDVTRDFLDARDAADAYLALLDSPAAGPVNVCSGRGLALGKVLEMLLAASPAGPKVEVEQDPDLERPLDPPHVVGDPGRLRELTGWEPRRSLEGSLGEVLEEWRGRAGGRDQAPGRDHAPVQARA